MGAFLYLTIWGLLLFFCVKKKAKALLNFCIIFWGLGAFYFIVTLVLAFSGVPLAVLAGNNLLYFFVTVVFFLLYSNCKNSIYEKVTQQCIK